MRRAALLMVLALLVLAACSGGARTPTLAATLAGLGRDTLAARLGGQAPVERPPLTRALLDTLDGAFLEVTLERTGALAYLFVNAERRDDGPGEVIVWRTEDNVTLAMRNGVLIATRGLGNDLLSATASYDGDRPGPAAGGERLYTVRAFDNETVLLGLACGLNDLGPATIVIVERAHPTRHLQESCEGAGGVVVNDYWVDPRAGIVWQSRQWGGPGVGYLRTRRLTE